MEGLPGSKEVSLLLRIGMQSMRGSGRRVANRIAISKLAQAVRRLLETCPMQTCSLVLRGMTSVHQANVRACLLQAEALARLLAPRRPTARTQSRVLRGLLPMGPELIESIYCIDPDDIGRPEGSVLSCCGASAAVSIPGRRVARRARDMVDAVTELLTTRAAPRNIPEARGVVLRCPDEAFVVKEARKIRPSPGCSGCEYIEMPTLSSIEGARDSLLHQDVYEPLDSTSYDGMVGCMEHGQDFGECASGSRARRARMFYRLLEMSSLGEVFPIQSRPYGRIVLAMPDAHTDSHAGLGRT